MTLPARSLEPMIPATPGAEPSALPATTPVTGGPPPQLSYKQTGGTPYTVTHPPKPFFLSPEEKYRQQAKAKSQGDVEGEVAGLVASGFPEIEARDLVKRKYLRLTAGSTTPYQSIAGEVLNDAGRPVPAFGVFNRTTGGYDDPATGQPLVGFRPRTTTGSTSLGTDREAVARELYGTRAADLSPEQLARVNQATIDRAAQRAYEVGTQTGQARVETEFKMPLSITESAGQDLPAGTTLAQLNGITPITDEQRQRLGAAKALAPQVVEIEDLIKKVFPAQTGLRGALTASAILAQKRAARDPDMARLEATINLAVGNISRVLAAESGRLTEQDVQRAQKAVTDLTGWADTQESALAKIQLVNEALARIAQDVQTPGETLRQRGAASPPPPPANQVVPGLFVGPDGELHQGSPTGPLVR